MKKKVIAGLLGTAMVASLLAGCGSSNNTADTTADTAAATEAAGDTDAADAETEAQSVADAAGDDDLSNADVAVMYYTYGDTYIASVRTALDAKLDALGVKYQDYDANNNQTTQNEQIDTAIQTGANVLIVNIVTSGSVDASSQIVEKAKAADIPVIFFNRAVEGDEDEGKVLGSYDKCAFVGTDAPEAGHMQGQMVGQYLVDNYDAVDLNGDGKISYAMFMGQLGNVEAIYRTQYGVEDANAVLKENGKPELEYFDSSNSDRYQVDQDGNWSATAANNYMTTNLTQYNEENKNMIELVICNNDGMAEGAISALNDKGYNLGTDDGKTIPVFGVDATDAAQIEELIALSELTNRAWEKDVQVMVEGPGHMPMDQIAANMKIQKTICHNAPFYVLGPLVTDIAPGYDHITSAIGGAIAAASGADFLCYVTPAEHLRLPDADDVKEGIIASRIAAHAADIAKGIPHAMDRDNEMAEARHVMDWDKLFEVALDGEKAKRFFEQTPPADRHTCSMCGKMCAVRTTNMILEGKEVKFCSEK